MKINKYNTGTPERMLQAFKNKINQLEGSDASVESSTGVDLSLTDYYDNSNNVDDLQMAVLNKLDNEGYDTSNDIVINYAEGAADLLSREDDPDIDEWWDNTVNNYPEDLDSLPEKVVSAKILGNNNYDYLNQLCEDTTTLLDDAGYEATARVEGEYIVIESMYDAESKYVQPIDDIEPNWEDLDTDAEELANAYMEEYPNPDYNDDEYEDAEY